MKPLNVFIILDLTLMQKNLGFHWSKHSDVEKEDERGVQDIFIKKWISILDSTPNQLI